MANSDRADPRRFHGEETRKENVLKACQREQSLQKQRTGKTVCAWKEKCVVSWSWCVGVGPVEEGGKGTSVRIEGEGI